MERELLCEGCYAMSVRVAASCGGGRVSTLQTWERPMGVANLATNREQEENPYQYVSFAHMHLYLNDAMKSSR